MSPWWRGWVQCPGHSNQVRGDSLVRSSEQVNNWRPAQMHLINNNLSWSLILTTAPELTWAAQHWLRWQWWAAGDNTWSVTSSSGAEWCDWLTDTLLHTAPTSERLSLEQRERGRVCGGHHAFKHIVPNITQWTHNTDSLPTRHGSERRESNLLSFSLHQTFLSLTTSSDSLSLPTSDMIKDLSIHVR